MTDSEIIKEISEMNRGLISIMAKECDPELYINMLLDQYKDAPVGLKRIVGDKIFNEIELKYKNK